MSYRRCVGSTGGFGGNPGGAAAWGGSSSAAAATAGAPPAGLSAAAMSEALDVWSGKVEGGLSHVAKAAGFVHFTIQFDAERGGRVVSPQHCVIVFPFRGQRGKHQSALFTLRSVREQALPRDPNVQGPVANHLRYKPPSERLAIPGADEYVEFELLSRVHEKPAQQPLRIAMGAARVSEESGLKEFVRIDLGQCISFLATDLIDDPGSGERLVQNRWWMCIETLRVLCTVNRVDCTALDKPGGTPLEWVVSLLDVRAPVNKKEQPQEPPVKNINELMAFIDGVGAPKAAKAQGRRRKNGKDKAPAQKAREAVAPASAGAHGDASTCVAGTNGASARGDVSAPAAAEDGCGVGDRLGSVGAGTPSAGAADAHGAGQGSAAEWLDRPLAVNGSLGGRAGGGICGDRGDSSADPCCARAEAEEASGRVERDTKIAASRDMLEVLDELERAAEAFQDDSKAWRRFNAIASTLEAKLRGLGLTRLETLGRQFEPRLHSRVTPGSAQAASSERSAEAHDAPAPVGGHSAATNGSAEAIAEDGGVIVEELESGWVLGDAVVRPALVATTQSRCGGGHG